MSGALEEIPLPGNPGQFNERAYYYARKIKWYQEANHVRVVDKSYDLLLRFQEQMKQMMKDHPGAFQRKSRNFGSYAVAEKGTVEKEDTLLFQILGCSHILAISGLH